MRLQRLTVNDFATFENPGVQSQQLVWTRNAPEARITMTRVTMQPRASTPRHSHPASKQTWVVEQGTATLLLAQGETAPVEAGDVIRTPPGETHGLTNTGAETFVYPTATTPPVDLTASYKDTKSRTNNAFPCSGNIRIGSISISIRRKQRLASSLTSSLTTARSSPTRVV
jgi:quercetin dioxygenase-like cupin family protein